MDTDTPRPPEDDDQQWLDDVRAALPDDRYLKLEILRLLSTPGRPPSTEAAQRFYDWITGTTHPTPTHSRRTHHHA